MAEKSTQVSPNPFCHHLKLSIVQKIQVIFMSITIAPLRFAIALILFGIIWTLANLFTFGADATKPASSIRNFFYQTLQALGRAVMFVCGFHYLKVKGKRATRSEAPVLLMLPHSSYWDALLFFVTPPFPSPLSKFENFHIPIFGTLMKVLQPILVHRNNAASKHDTINAIKNRVSSEASWPQLAVFPEGTCTNKKFMIKFKYGAFISGTPVQPVILKYNNSLDISTWTEISPSALYLIWLSLCQISLKVEITYLPVYKPTIKESSDPKLYANNVQQYLAKVLNVPCSDYTFEDRLLMKHAGKLKFPKQAAAVRFYDVSSTTNIKIEDALELLKEFSKMSTSRSDGLVNVEDMSKYLKVPIISGVQNLFVKLAGGAGSELTFRQYLLGYAAVANHLKDKVHIKTAYKKFLRLSQTNLNTVQCVLEAVNQQCMITEEQFLLFSRSSPLHCMLLLLTDELSENVVTDHHQSPLRHRK